MSPKSSSLRAVAAGGGGTGQGREACAATHANGFSPCVGILRSTKTGHRTRGATASRTNAPGGRTGGETGPRVDVRVGLHGRPRLSRGDVWRAEGRGRQGGEKRRQRGCISEYLDVVGANANAESLNVQRPAARNSWNFFLFFQESFFSEKSRRSGAAATRLVHPSPPRRRLRVRFPHRVGDRTFSRDLDRDRPRAPRAALAPNPFPSLRSPSRRRRRSPSPSRERERSRLRSVRSTRPPPSRRMGSPHLSTGTRPLAPPRPPPRAAGFDR